MTMHYFLRLAVLLLCTACSAQTAFTQGAHIKPHNALQELQARELQGGDLLMGQRRITVLSNVQIVPTEDTRADPQTIAHVAGHTIRRIAGGAMSPQAGLYVGAAYQHDTQDVGLISKEIAIRFQGTGVPLAYQKWELKELIVNSGIYLLTVTDLKQWARVMRQLQSDTQVLSAQARVVTAERKAK
jgi:hypothetical protein